MSLRSSAVSSPSGDALTERLTALQANLDDAYEHVPFGSYRADAQGLCTHINAVALNWLGCQRDDLIGKKRLEDFLSASSRLLLAAREPGHTEHTDRLALELVCGSGATKRVTAQFMPVPTPGGAAGGLRVLLFDDSVLRQKQAAQRMAALAFEFPCGICILDATGVITEANQAMQSLTGHTLAELRTLRLPALRADAGHREGEDTIWQGLVRDGVWQGEVPLRRKNGSALMAWLDLSSIAGSRRHAGRYVARVHDITSHTATRQEVDRLAFFDQLTQLPNRRQLLDRLAAALARCAAAGDHGALMFIDIDNFKLINDTRGHAAGDQLLVDVARRLSLQVRPGDTVARLGGDEFVVLLVALDASEAEASAQATKIGLKVLGSLAMPYRFEDFSFQTSASMGVTVLAGHESVSELLQQADLAMYEAKRAGRNALRRFEPAMREAADRHATIRQELWRALERDEFEMYYQPQVDVHGRVTSAEALVRWNHPTRGVLAPVTFIDAAEHTGLIVPMGLWVMNAVCRQLAAWSDAPAMRGIDIAMNVSARQFGEPDFVDRFVHVQQTTGADLHRLVLELTESAVHDVDAIRATMEALREHGLRFSLDDFGTGHSSLMRLISLPFAEFKIDQTFVQNMRSTPAAAVVVRTLIGMARSLGLDVVAEGVQTRDDFDALQAAGCQRFQGYLMGWPLRARDLERLVHAGRALGC